MVNLNYETDAVRRSYNTTSVRYFISEDSKDYEKVYNLLSSLFGFIDNDEYYTDSPSYSSFLEPILNSSMFSSYDRGVALELYNSNWVMWVNRVYFSNGILIELVLGYQELDGLGGYSQKGCDSYKPIGDFLQKYNPIGLLIKGYLGDISVGIYWDSLSYDAGSRSDGNILARGGDTPTSRRYKYAITGFFNYAEAMAHGEGGYAEEHCATIFYNVFLNPKYQSERYAEDSESCVYYLTGRRARSLFRDIISSDMMTNQYKLSLEDVSKLSVDEMYQYLVTASETASASDADEVFQYMDNPCASKGVEEAYTFVLFKLAE